jgi:hypothetical protein
MFWQMGAPSASLSQMAALATRYDSAPGAALIFMIGGLATLCGTVLLSAGLWRTHAVPAWTAAAIPVATIANIAGLSANSVPITIASILGGDALRAAPLSCMPEVTRAELARQVVWGSRLE